jgi:hypothetical protein
MPVLAVLTSPPTSSTGGTIISDQELATDASAGNPLIGIAPDRVPMAAAAAAARSGGGGAAGTFVWEKQW